MSADKLARMANQIATAFRYLPEEEAIAATMAHIKDFWNPLMRRQIYSQIAAGGAQLEPLAQKALTRLRERDPAAQTAGA